MGKITWQKNLEEYETIINDWHKIYVHKFNMGDVEEPELYAGHALYEWQQTEKGKFIMTYGRNHTYNITPDFSTYGYMCVILCELNAKKLAEYYLRWEKI
jgi:hypothetical protein